jgi:hypothetical protein
MKVMDIDYPAVISMARERGVPEALAIEAVEASRLGGMNSLTKAHRKALRRLMPAQERQCGSCTLCCRAPAIEATSILAGEVYTQKPAGEKCSSCSLGGGCDRYKNRPSVCEDYYCLWALGQIPEDMFPEDVGVCWTIQPRDGEFIAMGHALDCDAAMADERNHEAIAQFLRLGAFEGVALRCANKAMSFLPDGLMAEARIDQSDPMKVEVDVTTERRSRFKIEISEIKK